MSDQANQTKELADNMFRAGRFGLAIDLYTEALEKALPTTPLETCRTILANRTQAYISYGDIHTALRDIDLVLSPEYTNCDSPKKLTVKCHYRRAKLLCVMARYEEARRDYMEFARLKVELGVTIDDEERELREKIELGETADERSEQRRKDELMRAVDARGFILGRKNSDTFPFRPPRVEGEPHRGDMRIQFNTVDGRPDRTLPDPNLTQISFPLSITAPYFSPYANSAPPYLTHMASDDDTVGAGLVDLFSSTYAFVPNVRLQTDSWQSAIEHAKHSLVIMCTARGRFLVIPRETKLKDIIAGACWPRAHNSEAPVFEDLRHEPRRKDCKVDGVGFTKGWFMELYVMPRDRIDEFLDRLEVGFTEFGT